MFLKSIRLEGFKSFANKTIFELKPGITAVVGPNGSGKSNIVDAIKWVLGEQSVKSLRGASLMSDVIFNGSEYKDAMNKASVVLTFDNSDQFLSSDFKEIEVKRTIYKSGENDYFINNSKVRLKDIQNLFIDAGLGTDAFNIISQGSVTDVVNSKPIDRRVIFESAAGVLKYKKRKEESLRKLEKTKDNLNSVSLLIDELDNTILPLKEQAEVATKYVEFKEELKNNEIFLLAKDITDLNNEYISNYEKEEQLQEQLDKMQKHNYDSKIETIKLDIYKTEDSINQTNKKILSLINEIALLNSEKRINIERTKYEYSEDKIKNSLINLKEEKLRLQKEIEIINNDINLINEKINNIKLDVEKNAKDNQLNVGKKSLQEERLKNLEKEKFKLQNQIDILELNIANHEKIPSSVKNVLNNPRLKGIHNTIANVLEIPEEYLMSTEVALQSASNFVIVDNENCAKEAIKYLQDNKLGRATFFPLNIIKSRYIAENIIARIEQINGYVGILSSLVKFDNIYRDIIENQLGNVIVAKDIDSMNLIAKILEYKYRVVSLNGSIIYAGGSISGGSAQKHNNLNLQSELEQKKNKLLETTKEIEVISENIKLIDKDLDILKNQSIEHNNDLYIQTSNKESKINLLKDLDEKLKLIISDINGINILKDNNLDKQLDDIMSKINVLEIEKEKLEQKLNQSKDKKESLNSELETLEKDASHANSEYKKVANELNQVSVNVGKLNVKLDNLLIYLNEEYGMTYEFAKANYLNDLDVEVIRKKVHHLKHEIKLLGEVNTGSIKEYERLSERYNFLVNQKDDLELSMENLYSIITDMDSIMTEKFKSTFEKVSDEFSKVFKIMFQGGEGKLVLTDPKDFLNTGVDLIVVPPGKRIHSTQSLSGGEKSLTAICLLFAILNVSPVPFIVLDEVEAALDEVNVDLFGEYLNKKKHESQYILITHKKRMMEYADVLYGITMQNAGISKVVGVKLEDI